MWFAGCRAQLTLVDGQSATPEMHARLKALREKITIGVVGGSDLVKQREQLGENGLCLHAGCVPPRVSADWMLPSPVTNEFDYSFSENGLVAYHNGAKIGETVCFSAASGIGRSMR